MRFSVLALLAASGLSTAAPSELQQKWRASLHLRAPSPDVNVTTFFPLTRQRGNGLNEEQKGQGWSVPVTIGGRSYNLAVDTGSSDTWILESNFTCLSDDGNPTTQDVCSPPVAKKYTPGKEFMRIPDVNFNIQYGDYTAESGYFGMVKVTMGGITVKTQIAVADRANIVADPSLDSSGMLGLAYPALTSAFSGTNLSADVPANQLPYDPIFTSMWKQNLVAPVFTLAIQRAAVPANNRPDGYLALGGLAPVATRGQTARLPIEYIAEGPGYVYGSLPRPQYQAYAITPDAYLFSTSTTDPFAAHPAPVWQPLNSTGMLGSNQTIVDAGVTLSYVPRPVARQIASLFKPPGVYNANLPNPGWTVSCTAQPPTLAVQLAGVILPFDPRDLILDDFTGTGACQSGIGGSDGQLKFLGDTFLRSNMVVFDQGAAEIRVRSRGVY
ncbi:hypothetical protein LZ554_006694 [Drepanopeziza brunnea f. sp. 'monogermtubi']|nr:hypothetical protein LZ554_006694 [Drepanopeziza brunnea f. sp. 'monogermtubi']